MKKIIAFLLLPFVTNAQNSDSTKLIQKVSTGLIAATVATTTPAGSSTPFSLVYNLSANVCIVTPKTFHNFLYGFGNNALTSLNGYFLPKKWDVYALYSRSLSVHGEYAAVGIEKMLVAGDARIFLFSEVGTNLKDRNSVSIGVLLSFQNVIFKRK